MKNLNKNIYEVLLETSQKYPSNNAIIHEDQIINYKKLIKNVDYLASVLRDLNIKKGDICALYLNRSSEIIYIILAIHKIGAIYIPLNLEYPKERIKFLISDCSPKIIIEYKDNVLKDKYNLNGDSFNIVSVANLISYDIETNKDFDVVSVNPDDPAVILYTSGSTGQPKGTLISHKNIIMTVTDSNYIQVLPEDKRLQLSNYIFDASLFDIFSTLLNGGQLVLLSDEDVNDLSAIINKIKKCQITLIFIINPLFNALIDADLSCFDNIRKIYFGGETASKHHVNKLFKYIGPSRIVNLYGPTETTMMTTFHEINSLIEEDSDVSIGKAVSGKEVFVLDKNNVPVKKGEEGEICIAGYGNTLGYLNRDDLTNSKFVYSKKLKRKIYKTGDLGRFSANMELMFIGRADQQVKIRGFRIELREIESQIIKLPEIKMVIVEATPREGEGVELCAFYVVNSEINEGKIASFLQKNVPDYMVPKYYKQLTDFPTTPTGKIDRKYLQKIKIREKKKAPFIAPRNNCESELVELWKDILGIEKIGIGDSFFNLGGNSLKVMVMIHKIQDKYKVRVPITKFSSLSTIEKLSNFIESVEQTNFKIARSVKQESYPLHPVQKQIYTTCAFFNNLHESYNNTLSIKIDGKIDKSMLVEFIKVFSSRHETLKSSFHYVDGNIFQKIEKEVEFDIVDIDDYNKSFAENVYKFIHKFEIDKAPLIRFGYYREGNFTSRLVIDMHHLISDGISVHIFINELFLYLSKEDLPELDISYYDFLLHEEKYQSNHQKENTEYIRKMLSGFSNPILLGNKSGRPSEKSFIGNTLYFEIDSITQNKIENFIFLTGYTKNILMLSSFFILLGKISKENNLFIGSASTGRWSSEIDKIFGMITRTIILKSKLERSQEIDDYIVETRNMLFQAIEHETIPFEEFVRESNYQFTLEHNPIFEIFFVYQDMARSTFESKDVKLTPNIKHHKGAKFDLLFEVSEHKKSLDVEINYANSIFKEEQIKEYFEIYLQIITKILEPSSYKTVGSLLD